MDERNSNERSESMPEGWKRSKQESKFASQNDFSWDYELELMKEMAEALEYTSNTVRDDLPWTKQNIKSRADYILKKFKEWK